MSISSYTLIVDSNDCLNTTDDFSVKVHGS